MRVRITSATSVADGAGGRYEYGQVLDLDDSLAQAWIDAGHAEKATGTPVTDRGRTRREATRRAPRTTGKKAAGATGGEAEATGPAGAQTPPPGGD
ncbi:hypothetical protein I3W98_02615 [Streptomyces cavourensis]|nr:hypothetical protein [Streptomyces cavourensis]